MDVNDSPITYHSWHSFLVHSNLWSQCRVPVKFGKSSLKSALGVVIMTRRGRILPNTTPGIDARTSSVRCSILDRRKNRKLEYLR